MTRAWRIGRWLLYGLAGLVVLAAALWIGLTVYLSTPAGRALVARQIESRISMPVQVQSVHVGLWRSSIVFQVFDPHTSRNAGEVLGVDSASADLSVFDLLRGRLDPHHVDIRGLTLNLRLDAKGKLLTTLPNLPETGAGMAIPIVNLAGAKLVVRQEGRPDFVVENATVALVPKSSDELGLNGSIDDPGWSKWTVQAEYNRTTEAGWLKMTASDGPLNMDRLESIPYVPPSLWKHLRVEGRSAAEVDLAQDAQHKLSYGVTLRPHGASMTVTDADAELKQITGTVRLAGDQVVFEGMKAEIAGGTISANGSIDFSSKVMIAKLNLAGSGLGLRQLPESWGLPRDIQGKLQGRADLTLLIHPDGTVEPRGGGSGTVEGAKIRDIPVSITIRLVSNGKQYRFENHPDAAAPSGPKGSGIRLVPSRRTEPGGRFEFPASAVLCAVQAPDPKKDKPPPTFDVTVNLRDVEISELLEKLEVKLAYHISGKLSARVNMSVPVSQVGTQAAYQFSGELSSKELHFEGLTIRDLHAAASYRDGKLTLTKLTGQIDRPGEPNKPGTFHGKAVAEQKPPGQVRADLSFDDLPLGEVFKAIPGWTIEVRGDASGKAEFSAPYKSISDPKAWSAAATLAAPALDFAGRKMTGLHVALEAKDGKAALRNATVTVEGIPVAAEAGVTLGGRYPFTASLKSTSLNATNLRKLIPGTDLPTIEGTLEVEATASGTASPLAFEARGRITSSRLTLDKSTANHIQLRWRADQQRLVVSELSANLFGGTVTGSADVPFAADQAGKFELAFKGVDARAATAFVPDFPIRMGGQVTGKVLGAITPAKPGASRIGNLEVDLTAPRLVVQGVPTERLTGKASIQRGNLEYHLEGKALGGSFEIEGSYPGGKQPPAPAKQPPPAKSYGGKLRLKGIELSRLASDLGMRSLAPLGGRLDADFSFENDLSVGLGRITLTGLAWKDALLARETSGVLILEHGTLSLNDFTGRVAGGELRVRASIKIKEPERNSFSLGLSGADAKRLFAVAPELAAKVDGAVSLRVHGNFGREMRGMGILSMYSGTVTGVPLANLRVPFDWTVGSTGYSRIAVREATADIATGKAEANVRVEWAGTARVDGQAKFINVPIRTVVPEAGSFSLLGNGRITGQFKLSGNDVRSVNDLSGTLIGRLTQTSVREIPILERIVPFISSSALMQPYEHGDIRATLARGVFRVDRLVLVNPSGQIFAGGTITLDGRINALVVAHTGLIGPANRGLQLLGLALPLFGPVPLTLIEDVSAFLSNRTVRLNITGTTRNPDVRLNVSALLSEEAVRFFLARYVIPTGAAGALGLGIEGAAFGKR